MRQLRKQANAPGRHPQSADSQVKNRPSRRFFERRGPAWLIAAAIALLATGLSTASWSDSGSSQTTQAAAVAAQAQPRAAVKHDASWLKTSWQRQRDRAELAQQQQVQAEFARAVQYAAAVHQAQVHDFLTAVHDQAVKQAASQRARKRAKQQPASRQRYSSGGAAVAPYHGSGGCTTLENCRACVTSKESATSGLYHAYNPSGAAGRYQVKPQTWGGFGGYASAIDAPPSVQDEWFNQAYNQYHSPSGWRQLYTDGC